MKRMKLKQEQDVKSQGPGTRVTYTLHFFYVWSQSAVSNSDNDHIETYLVLAMVLYHMTQKHASGLSRDGIFSLNLFLSLTFYTAKSKSWKFPEHFFTHQEELILMYLTDIAGDYYYSFTVLR